MSPLTSDEIRFFKREGYLIKRGVLDPELMARARERKWAGAPARMQRDDPGTWFGPFRADEELVEERDNYRHDFTWKYMAPAREPWIVAMLATNPVILGWSQQLLGRERGRGSGTDPRHLLPTAGGGPAAASDRVPLRRDAGPAAQHAPGGAAGSRPRGGRPDRRHPARGRSVHGVAGHPPHHP